MKKIVFIIIVFGLLQACAKKQENKPNILVGINPLKYIVERIANDKVNIDVLLHNKYNDHQYYPNDEEITKLEKCDLFFYSGILAERSILKKIQITNYTDIRSGINLRKRDSIYYVLKRIQNPQYKYEHPKYDGHNKFADNHFYKVYGDDQITWLNPDNYKIIAKNILNNLTKLDSLNKELYANNYQKLIKDIDDLNCEFPKMKNRIILILNASIGYFADKYGFYQIPVHLENNTEAILELNSIINLALNQK